MKKILLILFCFILTFNLAACGGLPFGGLDVGGTEDQHQDSVQATQSAPETDNTPSYTAPTENITITDPPRPNVPSGEIRDPDDGTVLSVDIVNHGEIKSNAPALNSGSFVFEGTSMQLPFQASALFDQGWSFSENTSAADELIDPQTISNLVSFYLYDTDGNEISLLQAINNSDTAKSVEECDISAFKVYTYNVNETFGDLILPGGICVYSRAADVIEVYGEPDNNPYFDRVEVFEHGIRYVENKESGLCYTFYFYSDEDYNGELDGYIESITISTEY